MEEGLELTSEWRKAWNSRQDGGRPGTYLGWRKAWNSPRDGGRPGTHLRMEEGLEFLLVEFLVSSNVRHHESSLVPINQSKFIGNVIAYCK